MAEMRVSYQIHYFCFETKKTGFFEGNFLAPYGDIVPIKERALQAAQHRLAELGLPSDCGLNPQTIKINY